MPNQYQEELRVAPMTAEQFEALNIQAEVTKTLEKMGLTGIRRLPLGVDPDDEEPKLATEIYATGGIDALRKAVANKEFTKGGMKSFRDFLSQADFRSIRNNGVSAALKDLSENVGGDGGFLVPEQFRAEMLLIAIEAAIVRSRATVIPRSSNKIRMPAVLDTSHATNIYGGVQAFWESEGSTGTESQPTFRQIALEALKLRGHTETTLELMADSAISLEAVLRLMFGTALAYFEDVAFIDGTGAGQPLGILNAPALVSQAKETGQGAATIVAENLDNMFSRMLPSSLGRAVWLISPDAYPQLASLSRSVGTGGSPVFMPNIQSGPPMIIYGRPVIISEKLQTLGTVGDIYFADFFYYLIGDRQAMSMSSSEHFKFTSDLMTWKWVQRLDGRPWLHSAITSRNNSAHTFSPFVALATRS